MPNIKSAKKRLKQSIVRRERNRSAKHAIQTECKKVVAAVAAGNVEQAETELREAAKIARPVVGQARHSPQCRRPGQVAAVGQNQEAQGQVAAFAVPFSLREGVRVEGD